LNNTNALSAGHDAGAENWATVASRIGTCNSNALDRLAWLTSMLTAVVNGHKQRRAMSCCPWNYQRPSSLSKQHVKQES
jgi:hypothetical protein